MVRLRSRFSVFPLEDRTVPAAFTVLNLNDSGANSLRDCVTKANAAGGADTINFTAGLTGTITLTTGELGISDAVSIQGPGASKLSVSGNMASRIFNISAPFLSTVSISGLTATEGNASNGGAIISNDAKVVLTDCVLSKNSATGTGGAVMVGLTMTATGCTFSDNNAGVKGGAVGITASSFASMILRTCTVSGNLAVNGGGIYANNYLLIEGTTVSGNRASLQGGGIFAGGNFQGLTLRNSTISGNVNLSLNGEGGGIAINSGSTLTIQNCTITDNEAGKRGGGIARPGGGGFIILESSIVSGNIATTAPDIFNNNSDVQQKSSAVGSGVGFFQVDQGGNLPFGPHVQLHLAALADNGGPTKTHALGPNSPLINTGSNPIGLTSDQRGPGFVRVFGAGPDIGAFESTTFVTRIVTNVFDTGPGSLRQAVLDANAAPGVDVITFDPIGFGSQQEIRLFTGEIAINDSIAIVGPAGKVTINGNAGGRLFSTVNASHGSDIVLQNLIMTNCNFAAGFGGGIVADDEALTLKNCVVTNSFAKGGGFLFTNGRLLIEDCAFSGTNATDVDGGAVAANGLELTVRRSALGNHLAFDYGGAIAYSSLSGNVLIEDCSFTDNYGYNGGAIRTDTPTVVISRCTFSKNEAGDRGGAFELKGNGTATIEDCQFSDNTAVKGGGAINATSSTSTLIIRRSTLANNLATLGTFSVPSAGGAIRAATMLIEDSSLSGNRCTSADSLGGAILVLVNGSASIRRCTLSNNEASNGGAIRGEPLLIEDSTLIGNKAGVGGAIHAASPSADVIIRRSTLSGNTSTTSGGAIYGYNSSLNTGTLTLEDCTLSGNTAKSSDANTGGGAVYWSDDATSLFNFTARNCTFSGNSAATASGGAVCLVGFNGTANFQNSTLTNNSAGQFGGGIARISGTSVPTISSTIVAGNTAAFGPDIATFSASSVLGNNNLLGINEGVTLGGTGNLVGTKASPLNAKLGPLANNGGPTFTHLPLPGSPAINAGNNAAGLTNDQRGSPRVAGATADIGSFEVQLATKVASVTVNDGSSQRSRVTSLTVVFDQPPQFTGSPSAAFQLKRQSDNAVVNLSAATFGVVVTLGFTGGPLDFGSLADGRYTLTALASQILNLDGDNNGVAGGNFILIGNPSNGLFRLYGDADGNGTVNSTDFATFRTFFGLGSSIFDFENDGQTNSSDFAEFRKRFGISI